jgi:hypothetical protein
MLENTHRTLDDDNDDDVPTRSLGILVKFTDTPDYRRSYETLLWICTILVMIIDS